MYADAVFEGGGIKCIGLVGAACCIENAGYSWQNLAGTSGGALVAGLLTAGYSAEEVKEILLEQDFTALVCRDRLQSIPLLGDALGFLIEKGIHSTGKIEAWIKEILGEKGKVNFKDISVDGRSKLNVIASDITRKKMLILPDDIKDYGIDPMELEISKAIIMSMTLPFYFKPAKLAFQEQKCNIVDGGLLSNFPVWIFDVEGIPEWPTFGFKLTGPRSGAGSQQKKGVISYVLDMVETMLDKNELLYIKNKDIVRTITVPVNGYKTTQINLTEEDKIKLFDSGYKSAEDFLKIWDFEKYKKIYRRGEFLSRKDTLLG